MKESRQIDLTDFVEKAVEIDSNCLTIRQDRCIKAYCVLQYEKIPMGLVNNVENYMWIWLMRRMDL